METLNSYSSVLAAIAVWREARGQSIEARRGVLHVVLNRVKTGFRGSDLIDVILWPYQFSSFNLSDPNSARMPSHKRFADWKAFQECCDLVDAPGEDPTGGALMYHSCPVGLNLWPDWATEEKQTVQIGVFRFYRV